MNFLRSAIIFSSIAATVVVFCCLGAERDKTTGRSCRDDNGQAKSSKTNAEADDRDEPTTVSDSPAYFPPEMVLVAGGEFSMGDSLEDRERPVHQVKLSSFLIGRYEVTVAEFRKFMQSHTYITDAEKNGYSYVWDGTSMLFRKPGANWACDVFGDVDPSKENYPVIHISRNDAEAYCQWLSRLTGKKFRLATEAEWEYAAKGGPLHENFKFSGSNYLAGVGWFEDNSDGESHRVGRKKPNGLGVYDMSGNVWEWCSDWYGNYSPDLQTNPTGPDTGLNGGGVLRGGAWRWHSSFARCTARRNCLPKFNASGIGFRLAASIQ